MTLRTKTSLRGFFFAALRGLICLVAVLIGPGVALAGAKSPSTEPSEPRFLSTAPGVAYVGSQTCGECHADIYQQYRQTAMGQSMSLANDPAQLAKVPHPVTVYNQKFDRYFEVTRKGPDLFQSEYQVDAQGRAVFKSTHQIQYVIGAKQNGLGYIASVGEHLVEAPLSYYSKSGTWEVSPGYEYGDYGFTRAITDTCLACHSGRAQPAPEDNGLYRNPPFFELAIGCENCHGPGQLHVESRMKGAPLVGNMDRTIVNPAELTGWLADNICMKCHQGGDARPLQPGKTDNDFRPGTPLDDAFAIFMIPFNRSSPPTDPLLQHYISMILSKCYRASGGRLHCITCHDPHVEPSASQAPQYFRQKCLECHSEKSCSLPLKARLEKTPPDDCAGCHMPKQNVQQISHAALTNHRIVAYAGEPFPEAAFHMTTPQLPDLVHLDAIPGKDSVPTATLLEAYGDVTAAHPSYQQRYDALLDIAAKTNPGDVYVLEALGRKKAAEGTPQGREEAIQLLQRAVEAGSTVSSDYELLAQLLAGAGRSSEAVAIVKRGIHTDPFDPRLYGFLVAQDMALGKYNDALDAMKEALRIFPQDTSVLEPMLQKIEAASQQ